MAYKSNNIDYGSSFKTYTDELNRMMDFLDGFEKDTAGIVTSKDTPDPKPNLVWFHIQDGTVD